MVKNMSTAKKGSGDAAIAFKELGVRITDSGGKMRNSEDVFYDVISSLEKMKNETERDALAMAIFGKSAQQLNPLILGGVDALKQYGEEAKAAGLILSQETLDATNAFNDEIDETKAKLQATFLVLGSKLATALTPSLEKIVDAISVLCEWLTTLDPNLLAVILSVIALTAAIAPMLIAIGKISTGISALNTAIVALAGNPMIMMIAAAAAIAAALILLEQKTQIFSKTFTTVWNDAHKLVEKISGFFVNVFTVKIPNALKKMQEFFKSIFNGLVEIIKTPINLIIKGINWLIDGINSITKKLNSMKIPSWLGGGTLGGSAALIPHLPLLANGGVVTSGSAIVGEQGAELLTVSNGRATVQPLSGDNAVSAIATTINMTINSSDIKSVADFWRTVQNAKRLGRMT